MKVPETKMVAIDDLVLADYNPRQWSEKERADLKESLTKFGFVDPVIVNTHPKRKNVVVGGHFRVTMWKEMGNAEVPCVMVKLTEAQERELNVRLNKNTGSWDVPKLLAEYQVDDLLGIGFTEHELLLNVTEPFSEDDLNNFFEGKTEEKANDLHSFVLHFSQEELDSVNAFFKAAGGKREQVFLGMIRR